MFRRITAKQKRNRPLLMEQLETRVVLDGNVRAFVSDGVLNIRGDGAANEILIEQSSLRSFRISSRDGSTTINGGAGPRTFSGVRNDLNISMGRGNDVVEIVGTAADAVTVSDRLRINTGAGADQVLLTEVHAIGLHLNTGSGNDIINVGSDGAEGGLEITKEAIILTDGGQDDVSISNSLFKRFVVLNLGNNNDELTLQDTRVRQRSTFIGSSGFDTLNREGNSGKLKFISFERVRNFVDEPAPIAPVAANDTATVVRGSSVTINVAANDTAPGSSLNLASITITQQPTSGTAVANANGTVTYTNNGAAATSDGFQYTIRNQDGTVSNAAAVTVSVVAAFVAVNDTATVTEDATPNTATGNVLTNDTGGVGTRTVTAVNGSAANVGTNVNGSFGTFRINADGTFTYTLDNANTTVNALNDGQTLTDTVAYTANAGGGASSTANLAVTIQGTTDLDAVADTGTVTEDATPNTASGNVLTNDTGGAGAKTVTAVNGTAANVGNNVNGQFGTFRINADGSFTYTLNNSNATVNALNSGQTLTDTMNYTATAGSATDTATLTITIQGNTDVLAADDTGTVTEDATPNTATGNVLTNDTGGTAARTVTAVNGSAASVGQTVNGQFGTFQINANGTFTYTLNNSNATVNALNAGQTLTDTMNYTVGDGATSDTGTLTITIQGNTDVAAGDDSLNIAEDATPNTSTANVLTNDTGGTAARTVTAVNGSAASVGQAVNGQFGTFQINSDGSLTYTLNNSNTTVNALNAGQTLSDTMNYTVGDGATSDTGTVTVTIQGNTDVTANDDTASVTEDATPNTATGNVLTNDTGGTAARTVTAVNGSAGSVGQVVNGQFGTFQINADGGFTYTLDNSNATVDALAAGATLSDSMNYTVSDGATSDTATLTVTIEGAAG